MFNPNAIYLLIAFVFIYIGAYFLVQKAPYFQSFSQLQKSLFVKVIAIVGLIAISILFG